MVEPSPSSAAADPPAVEGGASPRARSGPSVRARRVVVAVLALLLLVAFWPLFAGDNFIPLTRYDIYAMGMGGEDAIPPDGPYFARQSHDDTIQGPDPSPIVVFWPQDIFTAKSIRRLELPLWNPYDGCGIPMLDGGQFRPFNPFRLPFYAIPSSWVWCVTLLLQLLAGAWGAGVWAARRGFDAGATIVCVGLFALNPWVLERLSYLDAAAYLMLPWCIVALERARWTERGSLAVAALALVLLGHVSHPEAAVIMSFLATAIAWPNREERAPGRFVAALFAAALAAIVALSVLWVPSLRLLMNGHLYKGAGLLVQHAYRWRNLSLLAADLFFPPALCGLLAAAFGAGRRPPAALAVGIAASVPLLFPLPGLGYSVGLAVQRFTHLRPFYFLPITWASVALLAPYGWQVLVSGKHRLARVACIVATGLSGLLAAVAARNFPEPPANQSAHFSFAVVSLAVAALVACAIALRGPAGWRGGLDVAMAGLVLVPFAFPLAENQLAWNRYEMRETPWVAWAKHEAPHERLVSLHKPWDPLYPNLGQALEVRASQAIEVVFPNLFHQLYRDPNSEYPTVVVFRQPDWPRFVGLGASILLAPKEGSGRLDLDVVPVPRATGRVHFADAVEVGPRGDDDLVRSIRAAQERDPGMAIVDQVPPGLALPGGVGPEATASFLTDEADVVGVDAATPRDALLVLNDTWYPGWEATIDGVATPILRVGGCFRGVVVPRGRHDVEFVYRPSLTLWSAAVSLLLTAALAAVAFGARASRLAGLSP